MSAGRHRRPSKASAAIATTTPAVAAGAIVFSVAAPASAHTLPATPPAPPAATQTSFITVHAHQHPARPLTYTVKPGDYLSKIAQAQCGDSGDWTGLYAGNKKTIGGNPDVILAGQDLTLDCRHAAYTPPPPRHVTVTVYAPRKTYHQTVTGYSGNVNPYSYSGFQQCVISRESGGNSQVMNSSGHYGLYQFSASTWEAYGGSSADFGHASVAEQNRVFGNAMAQGGQSNWSPYDGC